LIDILLKNIEPYTSLPPEIFPRLKQSIELILGKIDSDISFWIRNSIIQNMSNILEYNTPNYNDTTTTTLDIIKLL
jgi:hypothetical protein